MKLPVNEIFETIQGEAYHAGTPSLFIRLQGCDVGCPWCDTKHTWKVDPADQVGSIRGKDAEATSKYAMMDVERLVEIAHKSPCRHVVLTGGEPCVHDLLNLTTLLHIRAGCTVQIETSGTEEIHCYNSTWVTVSPKLNMPGGKVVREDALRRADEIKMPIGKLSDVEALLQLVVGRELPGPRRIWLQPLSMSPKATMLCVQQATLYGWRISIQTHKVMGIR